MLKLAAPQTIRARAERRRRLAAGSLSRDRTHWLDEHEACRTDAARFVEHTSIEERGDPGILGTSPLGSDGASLTGGSVKFELWPAQRHALSLMAPARRVVVLKARQLGLTWLVLAYALWLCLYRNSRLVVWYSDTLDNAVDAVERARFLYQSLPDGLKAILPKPTGDARGELRFDNGSILRARAATEGAGVSFTASLVVLDEMARMKRAKALLAAVNPTIEAGGQLICLSTAKGTGNAFHRTWEAAQSGLSDFAGIFLPWWSKPGRDQKWYETQVRNAEDPALIPENYPDTPEAAFVVSDDTRFPAAWIAAQRRFVRGPIPHAEWPVRLQGLDLGRFGLDPVGTPARHLHLYVPPSPTREVVVGADVADEENGKAFDAAVVLDARTGEQLAELRGKWEFDDYAELLCELAVAYDAVLCVERNNHGHAILTAIKHRERRLAEAVGPAARSRLAVPRIGRDPRDGRRGWVTLPSNKPSMIALIARGLRDAANGSGDSPLTLHSPHLIAELAGYRKLGGVKTGPGEGGTADLLMGLAVALSHVHLRPKAGKPSAGGDLPAVYYPA